MFCKNWGILRRVSECEELVGHQIEYLGINATIYFMYRWAGPVCFPSLVLQLAYWEHQVCTGHRQTPVQQKFGVRQLLMIFHRHYFKIIMGENFTQELEDEEISNDRCNEASHNGPLLFLTYLYVHPKALFTYPLLFHPYPLFLQ